MFERFSEAARRAVFFSRYEASRFGATAIEPEHLLLGLCYGDHTLHRHINQELLRQAMLAQNQEAPPHTPSVDLPLSITTRRIIDHAAEEADTHGSRHIECSHLFAALLREPDTLAAQFLAEHGVPAAVATTHPTHLPQLRPLAAPIAAQLARARHHLALISESDAAQQLKRRDWTRKHALGHLVDLATAHHHWIARALVEPRVDVLSYPDPHWTTAQNYDALPWQQLLLLWLQLQTLLVHVLNHTPDNRLDIPIRIGIAPPIPLRTLAASYHERIETLLGEILTHG